MERRCVLVLLLAASCSTCRGFALLRPDALALGVKCRARTSTRGSSDGERRQPKTALRMGPAPWGPWKSLEDGRSWVAGAMAGIAIVTGVATSGAPAAFAAAASSAEANKAVAVCLLKSCQAELGQCILNPKCLANLICLQTCVGRADETACQIRCGDLFENPTVGKFNACAVSAKKCVPQKSDDNTYPEPPKEALVKKFDPKEFDGRWYISAGLNRIFDNFDCQVHFFTSPEPGKLFGKLNWRIQEPDGEFFTRDTIQRFVQTKENPAILLNHNNEYLHYQDDWYILDYQPKEFILVYYRGRNDAWDGYGGGVLYTQTPTVPKSIIPRVSEALERANLHWADFKENDNSCKPADRDSTLLRTQYANKLFLMEEQQLQEQLTALRGYASDGVVKSEKSAENAIKTLEELRETYQTDIVLEAEKLGGAVGKELEELAEGAEAEVEEIEEEVRETIGSRFFNFVNRKELSKLEEKVEMDSAQ